MPEGNALDAPIALTSDDQPDATGRDAGDGSGEHTDDPLMDTENDPMMSTEGRNDYAPGAPEINLDRAPAE